MKNYLIAVIALSLLNGCGKKGEDQIIGKWSFSGNITEEISGEAKKIPIVCNLEFKKDSTYKEDCQAKFKDDDAQGTFELSTSGDWIYKKEEKTDGYFLMKPKDLQTKVVDWKQHGSQFSDEMLRLMNKDISKEKEKLTSDSEIKFTVLSEKNGKIFIEISSSTEDEFPIGSFSMEKYDEKKDKVKVTPDPKTASKKEGKSSASVTPDDTRAEAPKAEGPAEQYAVSDKILLDCSTTKHKIIVGENNNGVVTYRSWNKPKNMTEKADVQVSSKSAIQVEGTGPCRHTMMTFRIGKYEYALDDLKGCLESDPPKGAIAHISVNTECDSTSCSKTLSEMYCYR